MAAARTPGVRLRLVYKIDRFGRSVLHLSQQLAALTSFGVRFIAVSQALDTDSSNPSSRLMLTILAGVAEFEREIIHERTLSGVRVAKANGKALGRPRRVFRRDEVLRLRDAEGLSWRAIAERLGVPVSTVVDAYRCTEIVPPEGARRGSGKQSLKPRLRRRAKNEGFPHGSLGSFGGPISVCCSPLLQPITSSGGAAREGVYDHDNGLPNGSEVFRRRWLFLAPIRNGFRFEG